LHRVVTVPPPTNPPPTEPSPSTEVVRRRLLPLLAERFDRRVTVVVGGPGFGKSTLLRQAMAELSDATAERVDVLVRVPRSGLGHTGLVTALGQAVQPVQPRTTGPATDLTDLVDVVWSASPGHLCLIVDDAHRLDADAVECLLELVERLPVNGHLLVAGRPTSTGGLRRVVGLPGARCLDESDLRFDADEQLAFRALRGVDHDVEVDPAGTGAWPALLELELRTGRAGAIQYVIDEVVAGLDPDSLSACRRLAVLPVVDDEAATAILGRPTRAARALGDLPLTRVDQGAVEIHELLREGLHDGWSAEEHRAAVATAIEVAIGRERFDEALDVCIATGHEEGARSIARRLASELHFGTTTAARRARVGRLRRALGTEALEVLVVDAVDRSMDDPAAATQALDAALAAARAAHDTELEALCRLRLADLAYQVADHDGLRAQATELEELAAAGVHAARRISFLPQVWIRSLTNRVVEVVEFLDAWRSEHAAAAQDDEVHQVIDAYRIWYLAYAGHIRAALDQLAGTAHPPGGLFANRMGGFGMLQRWFLGELTEDDRRTAVTLVERIGASGQLHLYVEGAASVALFHASAGDLDEAERLVDLGAAAARRLPATAWSQHSLVQARAVCALLRGDEAAATELLRDAVPDGHIDRLPRHVYGATAALTYLLATATRSVWEDDDVGPEHRLRRDVGRALVALREGGDTAPAAALPWHRLSELRTWAFEPHLAELATAAMAAGVDLAETAIDSIVHDPERTLSTIAETGPDPVRATATSWAQTRPRRPRQTVEVEVLGPLRVRRGPDVVEDAAWVRRQRVRDLLGLLVEHRSIERVRVAELMWPDKSAEAAAGNLRFTLSQLVGVLEPSREPARPSWFVRSVASQLVLATGDRLQVDVDRFELELDEATAADRAGDPRRALEALVAACARYRGDYLSGVSDREWGYYTAVRLRGRFVQAATRATELLLAVGELDQAESMALRAAQAEPVNEAAHRGLAEVLLAQHRLGAARDVVATVLDGLRRAGVRADTPTLRLAVRLGLDGSG
jgi:DNA-binding SARP family transcriptional activator